MTRIAAHLQSEQSGDGGDLQVVASSARLLKLELAQFAVRESTDFKGAFAAVARMRYRASLIVDDPLTISNARTLAELAMTYRLASGGNFIEYALVSRPVSFWH